MVKRKKISMFIFSLLLFMTSFLFVACGTPDYSNVYLQTSESNISLYVDEEKTFSITIANPVKDMSNYLTIEYGNATKCSVEEISSEGYVTNYKITGLEGGDTTVDFVSVDGGKRVSINVSVKEYSKTLTAGENSLYVSSSSVLTPSSSDFIFGDNATEKDLEFFFYGEKTKDTAVLGKENITNASGFVNSFVSVKLFSEGDKDYFIFEDKQQKLYTLSKGNIVNEAAIGGTRYSFIEVLKTGAAYLPLNGGTLASKAFSINLGNKYFFVARNEIGGIVDGEIEDTEIFCERNFSVIKDIDSRKFSHTYGYKIKADLNGDSIFDNIDFKTNQYFYSQEAFTGRNIILIPHYTNNIEYNYRGLGDETVEVNYLTAYIILENENNTNLLLDDYIENSNIANASIIDTRTVDGKTIYLIEVNCVSGNEGNTRYRLNFYYDGFKGVQDDANVSFYYDFELGVNLVPANILVNGIDSSLISCTFYNYYEGNSGWQEFAFSISPTDASFVKLEISIPNNIIVRYKNDEYVDKLTLTDLKSPIYIRGKSGEVVKNQVAHLKLFFTGINGQEDYIEGQIKYEIAQGPRSITYVKESYSKLDIALNDGKISACEVFYADASFSGIEFLCGSPTSVVDFELLPDLCVQNGNKYYLAFNIIPRQIGVSLYSVALDNGVSKELTVEVVETLETVSLSTRNPANALKDFVREGQEENVIDYTAYLYNEDVNGKPTYYDIRILGNGDLNSMSINKVSLPSDYDNSSFKLSDFNDKNTNFIVTAVQNGLGYTSLTVEGKKIVDFKAEKEVYTVNLKTIVFNYINDLKIEKIKDAFEDNSLGNYTTANYVKVYSNIAKESLRSAQLSVKVANEDAFYFWDRRITEEVVYAESTYEQQFVYWEVNGSIYTSNTFAVRVGSDTVGVFNTETLTFIAYDNLEASKSFTLIAHVAQYGKIFSFPVNVDISVYKQVERLTQQDVSSSTTLTFSSLEYEIPIIIYPTDVDVTDPTIVVDFDSGEYSDMFDTDFINENKVVSAGKTQFNLVVKDSFISRASSIIEKISGTLTFASSGWLDDDGNILDKYADACLQYHVEYANGTPNNRYIIDEADDLANIDLTAHYKIKINVDLNNKTKEISLPLGELTGSIIGEGKYAQISNIVISQSDVGGNLGLFSKIAKDAYIENIAFSGKFIVDSVDEKNNIGFISAENYGRIRNVSVVLASSDIKFTKGNFGGLVGVNYGQIIQDFQNTNLVHNTTVFMTGEVKITTNDSNIGGVAGVNGSVEVDYGGNTTVHKGEIYKVDGTISYSGYTNYFAYSVLRVNTKEAPGKGNVVGGLVGSMSDQASLVGASSYDAQNKTVVTVTQKGKGVIVGGEVYSSGYVGGLVGKVEGDTLQQKYFTGLTSRVFVYGYTNQDGDSARIAGIANVSTINDASGYFLQAIDDGKIKRYSSMLVVEATNYNTSDAKAMFGQTTTMTTFGNYSLNTYVTRRFETTNIDSSRFENTFSKEIYYGDFLVIQTVDGKESVASQRQFTLDRASISVEEKFNNKMSGLAENDMYFTYYFGAGSTKEGNIADIQALLNTYYNTLSQSDELYPFVANGEMSFTSLNVDILSFDHSGKITIKRTGSALIEAKSILNTNSDASSLSFYIYVVNYFSQDTDKSIIHTDMSTASTPVDGTTIKLRGRSTAILYVVPEYSYNKVGDEKLKVDANGEGRFNNYYLTLAENKELTVDDITIVDVNDPSITSGLKIEVEGQKISISAEDTTDREYKLIITPVIKSEDGVYTSEAVNKQPENVILDYKRGALAIENERFNSVPLISSQIIEEFVYVTSTDDVVSNETLSAANVTIISKVDGIENVEAQDLFTVTFHYVERTGSSPYVYKFKANITINTESSVFASRLDRNIYGDYLLDIFATTNSEVKLENKILIHFEQTQISSAVISNYRMGEASDYVSSDYIYAGESGIIEVSLTPIDSDFDFVLIENDSANYQAGYSEASFTLLNAEKEPVIAGTQTKDGLKLTFSQLMKIYQTGGLKFNGSFYIAYTMDTYNVIDNNQSQINVSFVKGSNNAIFKEKIYVRLRNMVGVQVVGKPSLTQNADSYYREYELARGLKYELQIDSYGYEENEITLTLSDTNKASLLNENGKWYVQISSGQIQTVNTFTINAIATKGVGENALQSTSQTQIHVKEFLFTYEQPDDDTYLDIIEGMGNGVVDVQIGSRYTLALDVNRFFEYDRTNAQISAKIRDFVNALTNQGSWKVHTNIDRYGNISSTASNNAAGMDYDLGRATIETAYFNADGLTITPLVKHEKSDDWYYVEFSNSYKSDGSTYIISNDDGSKEIKTIFHIEAYSSSSDESPIPISSFDDLLDMKAGGYYCLVNDVQIPQTYLIDGVENKFKPLNGNFASFDGNGYVIAFNGSYDMENTESLGLFSSIESGTIVKNLTVQFLPSLTGSDVQPAPPTSDSYQLGGLRVNVIKTTAENFTFGGIAATNNGIITNCIVQTYKGEDDRGDPIEYYLTVVSNSENPQGTIAGLVGANNGYITNSYVSANIKSPFAVAGFVGTNYGKIAASYYKDGKLIGNSVSNNVAGFVLKNDENAQVITSYVSGENFADSMVSYRLNRQVVVEGYIDSYINSGTTCAGFAFENEGKIQDCYSNIDMRNATNGSAGFVYVNGGNIRNSFSLSAMYSNSTGSAGFANTNIGEDENGTFENCYYLAGEVVIGENPGVKINNSIADVKFDGLKILDQAGFADLENFADYSYVDSERTNAIWTFSQGGKSSRSAYALYTPSFDTVSKRNGDLNEDKTIGSDEGKSHEQETMTFSQNRLELVSPNIHALSIRVVLDPIKDDVTGEEVYLYRDSPNAPNNGTLNNPKLINTAQTFESEMLNAANAGLINGNNYRFVSDIDYWTYEGYSLFSNVTMTGNLEGNGMEISGIGLFSNNKNSSAGMFGQIGTVDKLAVVKNITISPSLVAFNNSISVGVLAGTINNASILDVKVYGQGDQPLTVSGVNFVGAIAGKVIGNPVIKDVVVENMNIASVYYVNDDNYYKETSVGDNIYSYAGGIFGYVGSGDIRNMKADKIFSVMGSRAGLAYGGVGSGATVDYTVVNVQETSNIKGLHYAGFLAGESAGNIENAYVNGCKTQLKAFNLTPRIATAVGGLVGYVRGGRIAYSVLGQDFASTANQDGDFIQFVGGLVGLVEAEEPSTRTVIEKCVVDEGLNFQSAMRLGGAVCEARTPLTMDKVAVKAAQLKIEGKIADPYIGGLVGMLSSSLTMTDSFSTAEIYLDTYIVGVTSAINVSGLIGCVDAKKGIISKIDYCYTTSTYNNIQAEDLRWDGLTQTNIQEYINSGNITNTFYEPSGKKDVLINSGANISFVVNQYGTMDKKMADREVTFVEMPIISIDGQIFGKVADGYYEARTIHGAASGLTYIQSPDDTDLYFYDGDLGTEDSYTDINKNGKYDTPDGEYQKGEVMFRLSEFPFDYTIKTALKAKFKIA